MLLVSFPAMAAKEPYPAVPSSEARFMTDAELERHRAAIERLENYLSGLTTVTSEFTQIAPDGALTSGRFYMQRPGKMRWQYNPPTPILMVANGNELIFYDYELQQVSYIPLDSTLIGFLAQDEIRFAGKVGIIAFSEGAGVTRVTLAQLEKPSDGHLTLEFSNKPLTIRNMVVLDATGQSTTVSLNNATFGQALDKDLFIFRDPRKPRGR